MKYFLSIFIERFGKLSYCRSNILTVRQLKELDLFTKSFKNSTELRFFFGEEIELFKKRFSNELELWHQEHPNKTNNCKIYANFIAKEGSKSFLATIPIMYKDSEIIPFDEAIEHIIYYLQDDEVLKRIWMEKKYLLLDDPDNMEYDFVNSYLNIEKDEVTKREFINHFINRIIKMEEDEKYRYFRCLLNLCRLSLHEIYTSKGNIKLFGAIQSGDLSLKRGNYVQFSVNDDYLNELLMNNNYDELYNLYSIDEIEKRR